MNKKYLLIARRFVQTFSVLLLVYIIWTTRYPLNGFINPLIYFRVDPFVMFVTAVAERVLLSGLIAAAATLVFTLVFGRFFCGWFCPLGAMIDLWGAFIALFRRKKRRLTEPGPLRKPKYYLLAVIFLFAAVGVQLAWFLDPFSILVRTFSFSIHPFINNVIDRGFVYVLQHGDFSNSLEPFYYKLKDTVLDVNNPVFPHTTAILLMLGAIIAMVTVQKRSWCRYVCPLGALLALPARFSLFKRKVVSCRTGCSLCKSICRMNAIKNDNTYLSSECVLCMDCVVKCPGKQTFSFQRTGMGQRVAEGEAGTSGTTGKAGTSEKTGTSGISGTAGAENGISRAQFLGYVGGSLVFLSGCGKGKSLFGGKTARSVIRPPASLPDEEFVQRCIRCGNCMKVCLTNTLQPVLLQSGWSGIWTPHVDTKVSYCEYQCTLCGQVCPTGAIKKISVEEKRRTKIGLAGIDRTLCIPWAKGEECLVCEEHCPISEKAIKMEERKGAGGKTIKVPSVDTSLCVGCAICENKCPVLPRKAISVKPV